MSRPWKVAVAFGLSVTAASSATPPHAQTVRYRFELRSGPAEVALRAFTVQSGCQIIFPSAHVKGVRTKAVQGEFTARANLERMLTGTPLSLTIDEKSGTIAIRNRDADKFPCPDDRG